MLIETNGIEEAAARALQRERESAHFYTQDGKPEYTQVTATGANKGKERPTTLRDARKKNLLPSITTIHKVKAEPMITRYRERHLMKACYEMRPFSEESIDADFDRALSRAREDSLEAARAGSGYRQQIENILNGKPWDKNDQKMCIVNDWLEEVIDEVYWTEMTCVDLEMGVAGQADAFVLMQGKKTLLDWKTRRFKPIKKEPLWECNWYKSDCRQLSFYGNCGERETEEKIRVANVGINTRADSPVSLKVWTREERKWALEVVRCVNVLWQHENNYIPQAEATND